MTTRRATLDAIADTPLALLPSWLSVIRGDGIREVALDGPHGGATHVGSVSVLPVYGVIEHRSDWMMEMFGEGVSVLGLREALLTELNDPTVKAVVLDIDSPGGSVAGITELASEIRAARGGKPIVAVANTLAASAAYWLASQADELVVTPSGHVGSIGVYAVHQDVSRMLDEMGVKMTIISAGPHKTEGNEFEPLSDEARADIQGRVDTSYAQFVGDVAAGRNVSAADVETNFGGGRVLTAKKAQAAGMVDRVETLAQTVQRMNRRPGSGRRMAAGELGPDLEANDADPAPFSERLAALAAEAEEVLGHANERARLRAKEGRPAFSPATEGTLRSIRGAIDELLVPVEPAPPADPVEPVPSASSTPPAAAPIPRRFQSREEWLRHLETN